MREYIKRMISGYSNNIIETDNGNDAIKLYNTNLPDAVLMDIELNGADGLTAAEKIRQKYTDSKIIFITDYDDELYRNRAANLGCIAYIPKENLYQLPFILKNLQPTIKEK